MREGIEIIMKLDKVFRYSMLISISSALPLACSISEDRNESVKPNILILLADDMGYRDIGCYGGIARTPNIDRLAQNGITFSNFYAAAPNCSPSRAALLTGRAPSRIGMYSYRPPDHPMHLRASEVTIAEILQEQGYQTSLFGKWHLGSLDKDSGFNHPLPDELGFDCYFATEHNAEPSHINPENFIRNGVNAGKINGSSAQILADEAISWIGDHHNDQNPFFIYLAFYEPHASTQNNAPPDLVKNYNIYPGFSDRDANYLANVENLDLASGRIINHLIEEELFDNTIIIFSSDNGSYRQASNAELRAIKSYIYEGGIRVPGIFHWPALNNNPETLVDEAAGQVDILPTLFDILKIETDPEIIIDGTSILSLLKGDDFNRENPLFWFFYRTSPEIAVRIDHYMIMGKDHDNTPRTHQFSARDMTYIRNMKLEEYVLYDLTRDISQSYNIFEHFPDSESYMQLINNKLTEIQNHGYLWEQLPSLKGSPGRNKEFTIFRLSPRQSLRGISPKNSHFV